MRCKICYYIFKKEDNIIKNLQTDKRKKHRPTFLQVQLINIPLQKQNLNSLDMLLLILVAGFFYNSIWFIYLITFWMNTLFVYLFFCLKTIIDPLYVSAHTTLHSQHQNTHKTHDRMFLKLNLTQNLTMFLDY